MLTRGPTAARTARTCHRLASRQADSGTEDVAAERRVVLLNR